MPIKKKQIRKKRTRKPKQEQIQPISYQFIPSQALTGQTEKLAYISAIRNLENEQKELAKKLQESQQEQIKKSKDAEDARLEQDRLKKLTSVFTKEREPIERDFEPDITFEDRAIRYTLNDKKNKHNNDPRLQQPVDEEIVIDLDEPLNAVNARGRPKKYFKDTPLTVKEANEVKKQWGIDNEEKLYDFITTNFGFR